MAQASEGKRKTKNKAKVASPMRAQADSQPLRESRMPAHSSEREPTSVSRPPSRTPSDRDSLATGPSDGADVVRYDDDDSQSQGGMGSDDGESARSTHATQQEVAGSTNGEDIKGRIAERAFLLYVEGGFQHGHDLDHWLEAEREILIGR